MLQATTDLLVPPVQTKISQHSAGPAKSDFDFLVCFYVKHFLTCPYDWKFSLIPTGCGTTWAIRTIDFAGSAVQSELCLHCTLLNQYIIWNYPQKWWILVLSLDWKKLGKGLKLDFQTHVFNETKWKFSKEVISEQFNSISCSYFQFSII
jgi:hypothetical protein